MPLSSSHSSRGWQGAWRGALPAARWAGAAGCRPTCKGPTPVHQGARRALPLVPPTPLAAAAGTTAASGRLPGLKPLQAQQQRPQQPGRQRGRAARLRPRWMKHMTWCTPAPCRWTTLCGRPASMMRRSLLSTAAGGRCSQQRRRRRQRRGRPWPRQAPVEASAPWNASASHGECARHLQTTWHCPS